MRALMYRSGVEGELAPDRLSLTEAVFQISEAVADQCGQEGVALQQHAHRLRQRLRRNRLAERHLRINRREIKQVYPKPTPKRSAGPPPRPFEPRNPFEGFCGVATRPRGP